jgi:hypothetical protein
MHAHAVTSIMQDADFDILKNAVFTRPGSLEKLELGLSAENIDKLLLTQHRGKYLAEVLTEKPLVFKALIARASTPTANQVLLQPLNAIQLVATICRADSADVIEKALLKLVNKKRMVITDVIVSSASEEDKRTVISKISQPTLNALVTSSIEDRLNRSLLLLLITCCLYKLALDIINRVSSEVLRQSIKSNLKIFFVHLLQEPTSDSLVAYNQLIQKSQITDVDLVQGFLEPIAKTETSVLVYAYNAIKRTKEAAIKTEIKLIAKQVLDKLNAKQTQQLVEGRTNRQANILHLLEDTESAERILIFAGSRIFNEALLSRSANEVDPLEEAIVRKSREIAEFYLLHANAQVVDRLLESLVHSETIFYSLLAHLSPLRMLVNHPLVTVSFDRLKPALSAVRVAPSIGAVLILLERYSAKFREWCLKSTGPLKKMLSDYSYFLNKVSLTDPDLQATFKYHVAWQELIDLHLAKALAKDDYSAADQLLHIQYEVHKTNGNQAAALKTMEQMHDITKLDKKTLFEIINFYHTRLLELSMENLTISDANYFSVLDNFVRCSMMLVKKLDANEESELLRDTVALCNSVLRKHYSSESKTEQTGIDEELIKQHEMAKQKNLAQTQEQLYKTHFEQMRILLLAKKPQAKSLFNRSLQEIYDAQTQIYTELTLLTQDQDRMDVVQRGLTKLAATDEFRGLLKKLEMDMIRVLNVKPKNLSQAAFVS